ncbi:hypothetical protein BB560_003474 [Smittium megazygosporum]|uniref:Uncharacterized protein n=1 Tax=Smittium megazygosporum TaxID=133381 RepID=A0A2T9ZBZ8_9FUNG|nr:hypothetical protein BB560_003474 [Smittium megazygosporum]
MVETLKFGTLEKANFTPSDSPADSSVQELTNSNWDFLSEPIHSRTRLMNVRSNISFAEARFFTNLKKKFKDKKMGDFLLWALLHLNLLVSDNYFRHPFSAVRNYTQLNGFNTSFSKSPFLFVTSAFRNIRVKGILPHFKSNALIHLSALESQLGAFSMISVSVLLRRMGYSSLTSLFNSAIRLFFYYTGYSTLKRGIVTKYMLGDYNTSSVNYDSLNFLRTKFSLSEIVKQFMHSGVLLCYFRDAFTGVLIKYICSKVTRPLLSSIRATLDENKNDKPNIKSAADNAELERHILYLVKSYVINILSLNLANIFTVWICYPLEAVLVKQLVLESLSQDGVYPSVLSTISETLGSGKIFYLYKSLPFSMVSDIFCFLGFFEFTRISTTLLLKLTKPMIEKELQ